MYFLVCYKVIKYFFLRRLHRQKERLIAFSHCGNTAAMSMFAVMDTDSRANGEGELLFPWLHLSAVCQAPTLDAERTSVACDWFPDLILTPACAELLLILPHRSCCNASCSTLG